MSDKSTPPTPAITTGMPHITVQIQQSHSSSPQSHPKQGFETVLIGPLIELPEALEGKVQLNGFEAAEIILT